MVSGQIKEGNVRLQISISKQANEILRGQSQKKGDISRHIEQLIMHEDEQAWHLWTQSFHGDVTQKIQVSANDATTCMK
jgi:hypothetical protein